MYRRRLTWLVIATFLLQVISPALTTSLGTALADTAYVSKVHDHGKVMPTTQELLEKQDAPKVEPRYTAPRASEENGPLLPNGTFQLADSQRAASVSTSRATLGALYTSKPQKKPGGIGAYRVDVSGTISSNTTWTVANSPYVVTADITVASPAILSVEPGVKVKFASGADLTIADGAGLTAEGTSTAPIVFTSYKDDIGGDDNGDGTATTPAAGDWGSVTYAGWKSGSTCVAALGSMKWVEARYGTSILVSCSGTTMTDLKIEKMSSYGLDILNYPANRPAIERLTLLDNKWNLKLTGVPSTDTIKDSVLMRAERNAIVADSSAVHVENSRIENNGMSGTGYYAITSQSGALYLRYNTIAKNYGTGNVDYGVTSTGATVNATDNWWGSTTGAEVSGQTDTGAGAKISTLVTYTNWLGKAYEEEHKRGNLPWTSKAGVGVDVSTGNFTHTVTDVSIATIGSPLEVVRTYNSKTADTNVSDFGYGWSWTYGQNLNLSDGRGAAWERADGAKSYFKKNPDGTFTSEEGVYERLAYDAATSIYTLTFRDQTKLVFNSTGKLVKQIDTDGNETVIARDGAGKILNITEPTGRQLIPTYTGNYITKIVGPLGESYNYVQTTLSTKATTTSVTKKDAALVTFATCTYQFTTYVYQMTSITDCDGNILTQTYDSTSTKRVKNQTWNGNAMIEFQYGPSTLYGLTLAANSTAVWDGWDVPHIYFYTKSNKVFEKWRGVINQLGLWYEEDKWEFTGYNRSKHRNIDSVWTADVIDVRTGNVTSHTEAYGSPGARTWDYTYDAFNNRTSEIDPLNHTNEAEFDTEQHLVMTRDALGEETATTYYPNGLPETVTDARGNVTRLGYDTHGYPASIENGEGEISTFLFNIVGWKVWEKDPELRQTSYTHNARGQVLTTTDPMGHVTATDYDTKGRRTAVEDAEENTTTTVWNTTRNSHWKTIDAEGGVLEVTLTAQGNIGTLKDPNGHTWTFAYNQFNERTSMTDPNGKVRLTEYTASGLEWKKTDAKGQLTTTLYNDFGEPTSIAYADGKSVTKSYDDAGYVLSMVDWIGTHTYVRDKLHRVTAYTNPDGLTIGYGFDEVGNNTSISYPGDLVVASTFDGANRKLAVTDWDGRVTTYDRDAAGRMGSFTLPNGVTTTIGLDDGSRVDSIVHVKGATTIASVDYSRDNVGNVTERVTAAGIESIVYDAIYRITEANYPGGTDSEQFEYDAGGNRTKRTRGTDITNYVADNADQLLNAGDGFRTYDNNGALLQVGSHVGYSWDARQQLVAIMTTPSNTAPTANAGPDQTGYVDRLVFLDASASSDPEGEPFRFTWTDVSGPQMGILNGVHAAKPAFLPPVDGTYIFSVTVDDARATSTADTVTVTVNSGSPPNQTVDVTPAANMSGYVFSPSGKSFTADNL